MSSGPHLDPDLDPDSTIPIPGKSDHDAVPLDLGRRLAEAQAAARVGTVVGGKWRIDRLLGMGGMAHVFAATHRNGRPLALKVLRPELSVEPLLVERFLREGYVANKVNHPGAVAVLDEDLTPDGAPFLVMELLHGRSLGDRLRDHGPVPLDEALRIADDVLDVLAAAHDSGIVHRDIKPDNVFQTDQGGIKVLDFGIARLREGLASTGATRSGVTIGTLGYMAPEQARGNSVGVDARTDVWAVGATLFTLLTGRALHESPNDMESLLAAMTTQVAPVATLAPELPPAVCGVLDAALAFDQDGRFADARAMQDAVRRARQAPGVSSAVPEPAPAPSPRTTSARFVVTLVSGLLGFVALAVGAWMHILWPTPGPARPTATAGVLAPTAEPSTSSTAFVQAPPLAIAPSEPAPSAAASASAPSPLAPAPSSVPRSAGGKPASPHAASSTHTPRSDAPDAAPVFDPLFQRK